MNIFLLRQIGHVLEKRDGFSLVELAISVSIIGILIGLIVGGRGLIKNSKIVATATQIEMIIGSVKQFYGTYQAFPGDYKLATSYFDGCSATTFCGNGDGNGAVGYYAPSGSPAGSIVWNGFLNNTTASQGVETRYAWRHLALAEFPAQVSALGGAQASSRWGLTHPKADIGGGFEMFYDSVHTLERNLSVTDSVTGTRGNFLRLSGALKTASANLTSGDGVDSFSVQAIDRKMDDGSPDSGVITAIGVQDGVCAQTCDKGSCTDYVEASIFTNTRDCFLFARLSVE